MYSIKGRYVFAYPGMAVVAEPTNLRRPPNEAGSLILQATVGCPWNRCVFCGNYKRKQFLPRYPEVLEDVELAKEVFGERPRRIFLADANSIVLRTDWLCKISEACYKAFPMLEEVSTYGGARFVLKKGSGELGRLREAGIGKVYIGLESGDDALLERMNKGSTANEMVEAGRLVREADMKLSVTVIQGLGGAGNWERNAESTAQVINAMRPNETRLHNLVVHPDSPLQAIIDQGEFCEASMEEVLRETRELIRRIEVETEVYTYASNYLRPGLLDGKLPKNREDMLNVLDFTLSSPDKSLYLQRMRLI